MKKNLLLAVFTALVAVAMASAQQISVVSEGGSTSLYSTLAEAINGADSGSVIYLPGGGFPIADDVKITKRLTIIGIGHRYDNDNVDGATIIAGNLFFNEGSDMSAVLGCHIGGDVFVGNDGKSVNNILVKYCNLNRVQVKNKTCQGVTINQNYIRNGSDFKGSPSIFSHNFCPWLTNINGGVIEYNIFTSFSGTDVFDYGYLAGVNWGPTNRCSNDRISNNILINGTYLATGSNNVISGNMLANGDWGDNPVNLGGANWNDVFKNFNNGAITPVTDLHFTQDYQEYSQCGIYGGTGFNDHQTAPVPYIVSKEVAEQTDASGHLNITVVVRAGE